jgi:orotidine-5'-phosphate decarboxylase
VVCSPLEAAALRSQCGPDFLLVAPGIRPASETGGRHLEADDQKRISTPRAALTAGATFLVIGRPITRAPDPLAALRRIHEEIAA